MNDIDKRLDTNKLIADLEEVIKSEPDNTSQYGTRFYSFSTDEIEGVISALKAEREEKERLKQEKTRIMKLYTEQLENDGNQVDKYEKTLKEITEIEWFNEGEHDSANLLSAKGMAKAALCGDRE